MNRLDRLTAILIHLQTKRVVRAQELASRFGISLRTVYRDLRSLEAAGVPIGAEAGVGYFLTDYHLPPVMFTNAEASSLVFGAKLVEKWGDESVLTAFESALFKIKSVLKPTDQEHLDDLTPHVFVAHPRGMAVARGNGLLNDIQQAVARHHVLELDYQASNADAETRREVEPVGLYHYSLAWHLIGFCRTRQDYRDFRVDRIRHLTDTGRRFARHTRLSLREYLDRKRKPDMPVVHVTVVFSRTAARFVQEQRHFWGFTSEENLGDQVRMHLCTPYLEGLGRWLLSYGDAVTIESPPALQHMMVTLIEELQLHYLNQPVDC